MVPVGCDAGTGRCGSLSRRPNARSRRPAGLCNSRSAAHTRSTSSRRWASSPELSTTKSAPCRRSSRSGWLAIRARASASSIPRAPTRRSSATSGAASTTTTAASESVSRWTARRSGISRTTIRSVSAKPSLRAIISTPMAGWVIALRSASASGSPNTSAASAGRSTRPSPSRISDPNRSTSGW